MTIGARLRPRRLAGPGGRLAVGDPAHVPAGIYAEQALKKLGVWRLSKPAWRPPEDVRGALLLVERGEAPAGIVYATDAAVSKKSPSRGCSPPTATTRSSIRSRSTAAATPGRRGRC